MKVIEKELAGLKSAQALANAASLMSKSEVIDGVTTLFACVDDGVSGEDLRTIALDLRNRNSRSVIGLASNHGEKVVLVVAVSDGAREVGAKAGAMVKIGSTVLGGGGGGKDDFAQGGGIHSSKIDDAFNGQNKKLAFVNVTIY